MAGDSLYFDSGSFRDTIYQINGKKPDKQYGFDE